MDRGNERREKVRERGDVVKIQREERNQKARESKGNEGEGHRGKVGYKRKKEYSKGRQDTRSEQLIQERCERRQRERKARLTRHKKTREEESRAENTKQASCFALQVMFCLQINRKPLRFAIGEAPSFLLHSNKLTSIHSLPWFCSTMQAGCSRPYYHHYLQPLCHRLSPKLPQLSQPSSVRQPTMNYAMGVAN